MFEALIDLNHRLEQTILTGAPSQTVSISYGTGTSSTAIRTCPPLALAVSALAIARAATVDTGPVGPFFHSCGGTTILRFHGRGRERHVSRQSQKDNED